MITPQQKKERLNGVGSSDAPIICGYSTYMTAYELYKIKRGEIEPNEPGERAEIGNIIEDAIAQIFTMKTGIETRKSNQTIYRPDYNSIFCHLDRTIKGGIPLEIKNTSDSREWGSEEDGPEGVPISHYIQVQHQIGCTGKDIALIAVLLFGNTLKIYEIPRDNDFIRNLTELEVKFRDCVRSGTPPEIQYSHSTTIDLLRKIYPGTNGQTIIMPESFMSWHNVLTEAKMKRKQYQAIIDNSKAHIMAEMGEAAVGMLPDETRYTRKSDKNGVIRLNHTKKPGG